MTCRVRMLALPLVLASSLPLAAAARPAAAPASAAGAATATGALPWHDDAEAGVRFRVPFAAGRIRTGAQVEDLIIDPEHERDGAERADAIPAGIHYTSGVYSEDGVPFVLVWTRADAVAPTKRDLEALTRLSPEAAAAQFGLERFRFDLRTLVGVGLQRPAGGVRARLLVVPMQGHTTFVGLYYRKADDARLLEVIRKSLTAAPERRLVWDELESGGWPRWLTAMVAVLAVGAVGTMTAVGVGAVRSRGA
jgi:hypothetical protein